MNDIVMMMPNGQENFVTVVSVGSQETPDDPNLPGYVTVLTIGDSEEKNVTEEVLVYRLPGERLGFGLKFEGGTKANEFVKRLFIQSCAPDSPASRVQSTWGNLTEGDEVLEIDCMPVNTMTRIDCVRCLKDSNVVIKLLVRHYFDNQELPQVVSAEKKRTPPPPPPVPPRKIPKKSLKNKPQETTREVTKRFSSPDTHRRDRRFSDGSLGPPDAEVYIDLFSQESTQSLSESDDTGSSISTVVDRFASFPTTTTSSLSGSLPSTPTSIQKHLDFTSILNDDELTAINNKNERIIAKNSEEKRGEDSTPLQPPSCFQDAPLSYGNEDMRITEGNIANYNNEVTKDCEEKVSKKPPVPPRSRELINSKIKNIHDENMNIHNLPRLVDFVPKNLDNPAEIIRNFLENERRDTDYIKNYFYGLDEDDPNSDICNEIDVYNKWSISPPLATIGEDEEEGNDNKSPNSTPIVIVENADTEIEEDSSSSKGLNGKMETLSSDSRQPPDGHEFPDYVENKTPETFDYSLKNYKSVEYVNPKSSSDISSVQSVLNKINSVSNSDLSSIKDNFEVRTSLESTLHTRSQSLIDMSSISKSGDRWSVLAEQRKRSLSKLKGLVIPEHVSESEPVNTVVHLPEIISNTSFVLESKIAQSGHQNEQPKPVAVPLSSPPWTSETILKYSPAFKRKNLQVYPQLKNKIEPVVAIKPISASVKPKTEELRLDNLSDAPKSLESITSPTRSDCSFDYVTNKKAQKKESLISKLHLGKSEDESDNDSAVSSSQSSYISRCSPPPSPTRSCEIEQEAIQDDKYSNLHCRLLKPASVEAINRKNILASAKCRSGRDLKVGSPVIHRKYDLETPTNQPNPNKDEISLPQAKVSYKKKPETNNNTFVVLKPVGDSCKKYESKPTPKKDRSSSLFKNQKSMSVNDLRKGFEEMGSGPPPLPQTIVPKEIKPKKIRIENKPLQLETPKPETVKEIKILEEPTQKNRRKITLCPEFVGGSIGITLAGGTDYETKEITVHKIRYGSVAYNDGTLKRGDRIVSINGKEMAGLTHAESVEMLKEPVAKFVLIVEEGKEEAASPQRKSFIYESPEPKSPSLEVKKVTNVVAIIKDGAGLGFSIEGGKDSLEGDVPLRVKKIFQGGAAEKCGELNIGDELLAINEISLINLSRIEVWSLMKKLPEGNVQIHIHR